MAFNSYNGLTFNVYNGFMVFAYDSSYIILFKLSFETSLGILRNRDLMQ